MKKKQETLQLQTLAAFFKNKFAYHWHRLFTR